MSHRRMIHAAGAWASALLLAGCSLFGGGEKPELPKAQSTSTAATAPAPRTPAAKSAGHSSASYPLGDFDVTGKKFLQGSRRIAVAGFRVIFATQHAARAEAKGLFGSYVGSAVFSNAALSGVDDATMQAVTDAVYADFLAELAASGHELVPFDRIWQTEGYHKIEKLATADGSPYQFRIVNEGRHESEWGSKTFKVFAPTGMPLFSRGEGDVFNEDSTFKLNWTEKYLDMTAKALDATVLVPTITLSFVDFDGAGTKLISTTASLETGPAISILDHQSGLFWIQGSPYNAGGNRGWATAEKKASLPDRIGEFVKLSEDDNSKGAMFAVRKVVQIFGGDPGQNQNVVEYRLDADPASYRVAAVKGGQALNRAFVQLAR